MQQALSMTDDRSGRDPHDLARFLSAQAADFERALAEIRGGQKRTHWMWYIFPQLAGLGSSATARHYAIKSLDEARAYLAHPVLGQRLRRCCEALLGVQDRSAHEIFGTPDDLKLRSSMTLFARAADCESLFERVLDRYFQGQADPKTLELLGRS